MKGIIVMVAMISAAIIVLVLILSASRSIGDTGYTSTDYQTTQPPLDFKLYIETTTGNFWDKVASLNTTASSETEDGVITVTDEEGNAVTDENGAAVTEMPVSDTAETPDTLTGIPEN